MTVPVLAHPPQPPEPAGTSKLRDAGLLIAAWSIPALCHTGVEFLSNRRGGETETIWQLLGGSALPWYIWASATPLVKGAARRFPLRRLENIGGIAAHAGLAIALTIVFVAVLSTLRHLLGLTVTGNLWQLSAAWFPFTLLAYAAIAASGLAEVYATRADAEALQSAVLAEQLARAQLNALRMQLHPHFLFNALNTVSMLVREEDSAAAVRLITELGVILRVMLRDPGAIEVPLANELDLIARYLSIEQIRLGDRLRVAWNVDPKVLDAAVPPLVLQPLVENAVRHGIGRSTLGGEIRIDATIFDAIVTLCVADDGPAVSALGVDAGNRRGDAGVGLANTHARLEQMYGSSGSLTLERTDGWTLATVVLPLTRTTAESGEPSGHHPAGASSAEMWFTATTGPQATIVR